jgi:hypothetical protein
MNRRVLSGKVGHRLVLATLAVTFAAAPAAAQDLRLPLKDGSVRFAVIGDTGTASTAQYDVGKQMIAFRTKFPFDFVIMVGDNIYSGTGSAQDFKTKFEQPYAQLLKDKVKFYAALGNHDNPTESSYKDWNMGGQRFYTWRASPGGLAKIGSPGVRFYALDSNYMDKPQLDWLEKELAASGSDWKICFFHHPIYSSGGSHGSDLQLRTLLEPLFLKYGVDAVFAGHEHFYERIKPQKGIYYWVCGAGGSLRKNNIDRGTGLTEVGFDTDYSFMLVEIDGADMYFQALSRTGQTIDSGVVHHEPFAVTTEPSPLPPGTMVPVAPVSPKPPAGATPTPAPPTPGASAAAPSPVPATAVSAAPSPKPTPKPTASKKRKTRKRKT